MARLFRSLCNRVNTQAKLNQVYPFHLNQNLVGAIICLSRYLYQSRYHVCYRPHRVVEEVAERSPG